MFSVRGPVRIYALPWTSPRSELEAGVYICTWPELRDRLPGHQLFGSGCKVRRTDSVDQALGVVQSMRPRRLRRLQEWEVRIFFADDLPAIWQPRRAEDDADDDGWTLVDAVENAGEEQA